MMFFEFHVSKSSRDKFKIEHSLFSISGDIIIANFRQARELSKKINDERRASGQLNMLVGAGQLNALGLMHEIFHYLIRIYEEKVNPGAILKAMNKIKASLSEEEFDKILLEHIREFPPQNVFKGKQKPEEYLEGYSENKSNREIIFEELILLNLENSNPAAFKLEELYSDKQIIQKTDYPALVEKTEQFFNEEKPFGSENLPLISFLKKPIASSPHSLEGQLEFIRKNWGIYIFDKFNFRLLGSLDLLTEDLKLFIHQGFGPKPTPPVPVYKYDEEYFRKLRERLAAGEKLSHEELDYYNSGIERFTKDVDWMPKVVMIAKNAFVWLDQLSKKYGRRISRLDEIPDEEIDQLARWNFTALWLIGIWERSSASRKIKQLTGNPEAAASAYSLYDYEIAFELGGEDAFQNLKHRAWQRGIRLASDMVPNHTGIYSKWIVEKPDYYIQSDYPPFPGYTFHGPNLSDDARVEVRIEDKYYSREDAAVVFQRRDSLTGGAKYIYHGNDGTHMPWNDTAQLNLMKPEVREALIQTIMHVAKKFPIIRFDAAMTLAKKHYQRLWFPQPGTGGAIPSRSDFAMTTEAFNEAMPQEFWREVVDRMNSEMPDTLLLAEAFWLMEGYFVRSLGMHRVYNSAFMHMLMKEENNKYRELIKNTLDFNPEILKRYVNFMSNPDEETAVNQFGKGDKYFGAALLMITLPGLPMFGHGQVEGLSEKYGMEYKKAYYDEMPDGHLISRHETEIFPLMKKRYLFSQVNDFEFYDFIDDYGAVNESVFAYSNFIRNERALVVYNNAYQQCKGRINYSVIKAVDDNGRIFKRTVKAAEALRLKKGYKDFYTYRESKTGLEFILSCEEVLEHGFYFQLNGYEYKIFLDFKEIYDSSGEYDQLKRLLNGDGVPSIDKKIREIHLAPIHESLHYLLNRETYKEICSLCFDEATKTEDIIHHLKIPNKVNGKLKRVLNEAKNVEKILLDEELLFEGLEKDISCTKALTSVVKEIYSQEKKLIKQVDQLYPKILTRIFIDDEKAGKTRREVLITYFFLNRILHSAVDGTHFRWNILFDSLQLKKVLTDIFKESGHNVEQIFEEASLINALISKQHLLHENVLIEGEEEIFISMLIDNNEVSEYLMLNEFGGIVYYNKERFENLLDWVFLLSLINKIPIIEKSKTAAKDLRSFKKIMQDEFQKEFKRIEYLNKKSDESGYKLSSLKESLRSIKLSGQSKDKVKKPGSRPKVLPVKKKKR